MNRNNYITFDFSNMIDQFQLHNNGGDNEDNELDALFNNEESKTIKKVKNTFIKELNENKYTVKDDDNLSCCLCMEDFKFGEIVFKLPCNDTPHYFHIDRDSNTHECDGITEWFHEKNTCPICRTEFPYDEIKPIRPPDIIEYPIENIIDYYNPSQRINGQIQILVDELENNILNPIPFPEYIPNIPQANIPQPNLVITNTLMRNFIDRAFEEEEDRQIQEAIELSLRD